MNRRDDLARGRTSGGTLIHNGTFYQSQAICSLAVPLIQSCFQGFSVTEVGCAELFPAGFLSATVAAVTMTAVAAAADPEYGPAFAPTTNPLSENIFAGLSHSHPKARLDIGCGSWQPICSVITLALSRDTALGSGRGHGRGLLLSRPSRYETTRR